LFKIDLQLVALNQHNCTIAEFFMENAQTNAEIASAHVPKTDGAAGIFGYALRAGVKAARGGGALPAWASRIASALVGGRQMRERVGLFTPIRPP
jgi:hypothetical protein